ncbi:MAG TPA: hypothetical protein VNQ77_05090 [Frankiaceae bacterium]|nr:hypothetical protein [Frankiaceae bacterium]
MRAPSSAAAAALALAAGALVAPPAAASWAPSGPAVVTTFGCTSATASGDAATGSDGVPRGFVRAEGGTCAASAATYVERRAGTWHATPAPFRGRVLAVADDGASTYLLYAARDGLRLGRRTHAGTYVAPARLSTATALSGDVVAAGRTWWAVWSERVAGGSSLFQARTIGTTSWRQRITWLSPRDDDRPSLARLADGSMALAYQRRVPSSGRTDVHRARSTGGRWSFAQVTANGASGAPSMAASASRQLLAWTQAGRVMYADDTAGAWRSRVLATSGTAPRATASAGRVFVAWTSGAGHAVLAERSGAVWVTRDVTPGATVRGSALAVAAAGGSATVLVAEPARVVARTQARPSTATFRHLGAWVDLFDGALSPAAAVATMRAYGVRTLYFETARFDSPAAIADTARTAAWLDAAHAAGLRAVAWYLPGYSEHLDRDVARTVAAARFVTAKGNRFDAVGVDVEHRGASASGAEFNDGVVAHLQRVRAALGTRYPIGAIVPSPVGMSLNPALWQGFPWAAIGTYADVVLPMAYWSYRTDRGTNPAHAAYRYTRDNVSLAARYTGLPVHVIGGVANAVTATEVAEFVRGARDARAWGASLYDTATTPASFWPLLRLLSP